ncbi:FlgD immunoglobulin-like domain containing protein [Labrenzia sp. OB1]|uniref:flagellar hook assembly protein FlgD n=1 Tax=Labrenzia sp. OB1 TaxID=1561204 RepID=UPI0007B2A550|nr:FlgD immunoglobulin-like domain containing protein [Labrenzia sp. OB1]KZM50500.1 flagellar hook capping protein FlgD [Labrenzia sp. OB1]
MTISTVNSYTAPASATSTTSADDARTSIDGDEFLLLMVQQLQNQDPTNPADTNEYISQMIDSASYETQSDISSQITSLTDTISNYMSSQGLGYLGQTVEAIGNTTSLQDGEAQWSYTLESEAENVTISILDEDGNTVYSETGETSEGAHSFAWDGVTSDGEQLQDGGQYTIQVAATDADGDDVSGHTTVVAQVTAVDTTSDEAVLGIGDASVLLDNVLAVLATQ